MSKEHKLSLVLPRPVQCPCGKSKLVPLLTPVQLEFPKSDLDDYEQWGTGYKLTWECPACGKVVPKS